MADSNIGSRITVISKANIRYEGLMNFIDPEESTIGLKDVRMFGSEGRRGGGSDEIEASPQHYEFIVFRGADISNVAVHEDSSDTPTVTDAFHSKGDGNRLNDRAHRGGGRGGGGNHPKSNNSQEGINNRNQPRNDRFDMNRGEEVNSLHGRNNNSNNNNINNNNRYDNRDNTRRGGDYSRNYRGGDHGHQDRSGRGGGARYNDNNYGRRDDRIRPYEGGRGGGRGRYHHGGGGGGGGGYRSQQDFHTGRDFEVATGNARQQLKEFDFVKAGDDFEKQKAEFRKEQEKEGVKVAPKYDSSSFFDSISCESVDRKEHQGIARHNREGQRVTDTETFGSDMIGTMRGFRRGRGRGGRGHYERY